jgi:hypothetical protein
MVVRDYKRSQLPFRTVFTYQLSARREVFEQIIVRRTAIWAVAEAGARVKSW